MVGVGHNVHTKGGRPSRRTEVIPGPVRRRRWSVPEKLAVVAESYSTTTSISEVARRHGVNVQQLFTWRRQFRQGDLDTGAQGRVGFVPVRLTPPPQEPPAPPPEPAMIEIVVGAVTVRVPPTAGEPALRRVLDVLRSRP